MQWAEAFPDTLHCCIGVRRYILLAYIIRKDVTPTATPHSLMTDLPYSEEAGSVQNELIERASHSHPNYKSDKGTLYSKLEESTRSTVYAVSIKPFQQKMDGKTAYDAIIKQYVGDYKWTTEVVKYDALLHNDKWKGTNNFPLERFCALHRSAFEQLTLASGRILYQLPTQYTSVGYLLNVIETSDAELQAEMSGVRSDKAPGGKRFDFEKVVIFITSADPVVRRLGNPTRNSVQISGVTIDKGHSTQKISTGIGKTGMQLRF